MALKYIVQGYIILAIANIRHTGKPGCNLTKNIFFPFKLVGLTTVKLMHSITLN